jgi:restriction system protein
MKESEVIPNNDVTYRVLEYLVAQAQERRVSIVAGSEISAACQIADSELRPFLFAFNQLAFDLVAIDRLELHVRRLSEWGRLSPSQRSTFASAHAFFVGKAHQARMRRLMPVLAAAVAANAKALAELPTLTLMAVLELGEKVEDGMIVKVVTEPWWQILEILDRDPRAAFEIPSRTWEEIIAGAYEQAGFDEVILTPRSGDLGRDVIATKNGFGSIRLFDQVKAYAPGNLVTADEVRAMAGILQGNVSKGVVTTTSMFAPKLLEDRIIGPLIPHRVELRDGQGLRQWLDEVRAQRRG